MSDELDMELVILIHSGSVEGFYNSYADAVKEGYEKFGLEPFLVKCVLIKERTYSFTRDLVFDKTAII